MLLRCPSLSGADEAADILTQHYLVPNLLPPTESLLRAALLTSAVQIELKKQLPLLHAAFRANSGVIAGTEPATAPTAGFGAPPRLALASSMVGLKLGGPTTSASSSSVQQPQQPPVNSAEANKKRPLSSLAMNVSQFTNVLSVSLDLVLQYADVFTMLTESLCVDVLFLSKLAFLLLLLLPSDATCRHSLPAKAL